jgi:hypothetical protein
LYIYYKIKTQDLEVTKKDFYESLESYFEGNSTTVDFANFDLSTRSTLTTMKELGKTNPKILVGTLKSIYESFITTECELRRKVSNFDFYAEEELMNELRSYLIKTIKAKSTPIEIQEICLKLILLLGNQRGSGEDYLIVYNLIAQNGFNFNIDAELSQCRFVESKGQGDKGDEELLKVSYEGSSSGHMLKGGDCDLDFNAAFNITADSHYIYLYQKDKGLHKFGYSDSVDTKIGRLYKKNSGMSDANRYFMYLNGKLYCRAPNSEEKPFSLVDKDTLEETTDNEEFNKKIEALIKKTENEGEEKKEEEKKEEEKKEEEKKEEKKETKKEAKKEAKKEEEPKGPKLEWTKIEDDDEEKKGGRYLCESPLFTDGEHIYVISTEREIKITKKEEEDLDEDRTDLVIKKWFLEVYDAKDWSFKNSIELKLDIKVRGLDEVISEAEEKETDYIKKLRESLSMQNITNCSFTTNGYRLLIGETNRWHIYDLKSHKWTFGIGLTNDPWGFDYATNTFWELTSSQVLQSFKIPAFKRIETKGDSSSKGIIEYINAKVNEIQKLQTVKDKIGKTTAKTLFKNLKKRAEHQSKALSFDTEAKPQYSRFLIMNILKEGSKELIAFAEEINPNAPVSSDKLALFRGKHKLE